MRTKAGMSAVIVGALFLLTAFFPAGQVIAQTSNLPVVSVTVVNHSSLSGTGYYAVMWRYADTGGSPTGVAEATLDAGQAANLYDPSLSSFSHSTQFVHYSVLVLEKMASGSWAQLANYHWASQVTGNAVGVGGQIAATRSLTLTEGNSNVEIQSNGAIVPYVTVTGQHAANTGANVTGGSAGAASAAQQLESTSLTWPLSYLLTTPGSNGASRLQPAGLSGCFSVEELAWCWNKIDSWSNLWTSIGEATGSGYMSDTFSYGVDSSSQLGVSVSSGGGSWSISGSWTQTNQNSQATTWPVLHCCTNYLSKSQFNYEEDQLCIYILFVCEKQSSYQIWAPGWDGSADPWLSAGASGTSPGDCLSLSTIQAYGYSYGEWAGGSMFAITNTNGFTYTLAASISSPIGGTGSASISDTTAYNSHTTQAILFGTQYSLYYLYSNTPPKSGVNQWPVLFSSNSNAHCGP